MEKREKDGRPSPPKKRGAIEIQRGEKPGGKAETPRIQATEEMGQGTETRETHPQREAWGPDMKTETQKEWRREIRERRPEAQRVCMSGGKRERENRDDRDGRSRQRYRRTQERDTESPIVCRWRERVRQKPRERERQTVRETWRQEQRWADTCGKLL